MLIQVENVQEGKTLIRGIMLSFFLHLSCPGSSNSLLSDVQHTHPLENFPDIPSLFLKINLDIVHPVLLIWITVERSVRL